MKKFKWDRNSIVFKLMVFVILLIFSQSALLIATMIIAGVLKEAEENAFQSFYEKANNRKDYIQREMSSRWTNIDPYLNEISKMLPEVADKNSTDQFLKQSAPILISMLRTTMTNGTYIILNDQLDDPDQHTGLYFRDYDPLLNNDMNKDLYFVAGPFEMAKMLSIPMDHNWSYNLKLTKENRGFYDNPYLKAGLSTNSHLLGYWSLPFQLAPNDLPIITYSMPIFDKDHKLRGIIGVELLIDYFNQFLPSSDLQARDSLGYLIGYKASSGQGISPIVTNGALQKRMLHTNEEFRFVKKDVKRDIYLLENHNSQDNVYASVQKMGLYEHNTPFEQEEWYLIGLMEESKLLSFVEKIQNILVFSFLGSIAIGGTAGYFVSYELTKPIYHLAKQVGENDLESGKSLTRTGFTEIDDLSRAIETANQNLLDSTLKFSRIIELVDVPIGAFEYKENEDKLFATDQLKQVLQFEENEVQELYRDKTKFITRLKRIFENLEPDEENIYKISECPEKWVRINIVNDENSTLGIAIDVTEDILEKKQIKLDRDHDMLTKIFNRGAFERNATKLLEQGSLKIGAIIMLDLDYLKKVNDCYGHKWGDLYIQRTADFLSVFREKNGIIGRLSGDEFSVFLHGFDSKKQIRELVKQFYKEIDSNPIPFADGDNKITISAGLFWLDDNEVRYQFDDISQKADEALYYAKNHNKGSYREYTQET